MYRSIQEQNKYENDLLEGLKKPSIHFVEKMTEWFKGSPVAATGLLHFYKEDPYRLPLFEAILKISNQENLHYVVLYRAMYYYDLFLKEASVFSFGDKSWFDVIKEMTERQYGCVITKYQVIVSLAMVFLKTAHVLESPDDSSSIGIFKAGRDMMYKESLSGIETQRNDGTEIYLSKFLQEMKSPEVVGKALLKIETFFLDTIKYALQSNYLAFHYIRTVTKFLEDERTSLMGRKFIRHLDIFIATHSTFSYTQEEIAEAFISLEGNPLLPWTQTAEVKEFMQMTRRGLTETIQNDYLIEKSKIPEELYQELNKRYPDHEFKRSLQKMFSERVFNPPSFFYS